MTASIPAAAGAQQLKRFFRTPKGLLIVVFALLLPLAAIGSGVSVVWRGVTAAALAAMLVDAPILRARSGEWTVPDGAFLTGLIVAMVLSPREPWYVCAITSVLAVVSKYPLRYGSANIFNPAALALFISYFVFATGQSWWGALAELPMPAIAMLVAAGAFIADRVNKLPAVLSFLGVYYLLFTMASYAGDPGRVVAIYREPDVHMALFFAFFMVTDPPTSPPKARDQLVFGVIVAVSSFAIFELVGAVYFLLAGLLVGNAWEAVRRHRVRAARERRRAATA